MASPSGVVAGPGAHLDAGAALDRLHDGGEVAVGSDLVAGLLAGPEAATNRIAAARAGMAWEPYVEGVRAAMDTPPPPDPGRAARAGLGAALRAEPDGGAAELAELRADLARHGAWLEAMNASLSWRLTAPLRAASRALGRRS